MIKKVQDMTLAEYINWGSKLKLPADYLKARYEWMHAKSNVADAWKKCVREFNKHKINLKNA